MKSAPGWTTRRWRWRCSWCRTGSFVIKLFLFVADGGKYKQVRLALTSFFRSKHTFAN